ncbi:TetR/AcrR family transcriptional regulator [Lentzea flaviverrucosa]|uniref:Transcriptional regulator, TetR family n=1 Tax=Lentzea flaviverrucosa TaxID=200379 RepID=A0A1H9FI28_9PSEU|nr:TetR/AcrR family transcriptional regulator [Lentzea flaviverrucosa]RDI35191.1 TetR family transcriptional regulator [Lentzea flaviverrucosa]SEQ37455.1 transcriptional regulator, TetR family [Lentzea flaviverrucosa]
MRADAVRNRGLLIEVALDAFTHEKDVTLGAIAKKAGVGIGTLYRHFPTREALIEAVYRTELEKLCDAAPELLETHEPAAALREWMDRFIAYAATKRDLKDALQAVIALGLNPFEHSRAKMTEAVQTLLTPLNARTEPMDLMALLIGVAQNGDPDQARRMLDLIMNGVLHDAAARSAPPASAPR